jgi:hypothetical protein
MGKKVEGQPLTYWNGTDADLAAVSRQRDAGESPRQLAGLTLQPEWRWTRILVVAASQRPRGRAPRGNETICTSKPAGPLADVNFQELIRIVNEAQERDAEDERRLYNPMLGDRS